MPVTDDDARHRPQGEDDASQQKLAALRRELVRLRDAAGLTQRQVSALTGWSQSKIIRMEGGPVGIRPADVAELLRHYDVTDPATVARYQEQAREVARIRGPRPTPDIKPGARRQGTARGASSRVEFLGVTAGDSVQQFAHWLNAAPRNGDVDVQAVNVGYDPDGQFGLLVIYQQASKDH